MSITVRKDVAKALSPELEHIAPSVMWRIPDTNYVRVPRNRHNFQLAWTLITLYQNSWARLKTVLRSDADNAVSDAQVRWHTNLKRLMARANEVHGRVWDEYSVAPGEYHSKDAERRARPHPAIKNVCGLTFTPDDLMSMAQTYMIDPLRQPGTVDSRLLEAAAGAVNFILVCYTNVFTHRNLETGEVDGVISWGGSLVNINMRRRLSDYKLMSEPYFGLAAEPNELIREEMMHRILGITAECDIDPTGGDKSIFGKLRQEFQSIPARVKSTNKSTPTIEQTGHIQPQVLFSRFSELFGKEVLQHLLVAPDVVNSWRTRRCGEMKGTLEWILEHEQNEKLRDEILRNLAFNHNEVMAVPPNSQTITGHKELVAALADVRRVWGATDDRRRVYTEMLETVTALRPARLVEFKPQLAEEIKLQSLMSSVYVPTTYFESAVHDENVSLHGDLAASVKTVKRKFHLGQPQFVTYHDHVHMEAKKASLYTLAVIRSMGREGEEPSYALPVKFANVETVDTPLLKVEAAVNNVYDEWFKFGHDYAGYHFEKLTLDGVDYTDDENEDAKEFRNWLNRLGSAQITRIRSLKNAPSLRTVPDYFWFGVGFFVDSELRIRTFELRRSLVETLERGEKVEEGYIVLRDIDQCVDPDFLVDQFGRDQHGYSWLQDQGVIPHGLLASDESFEAWPARRETNVLQRTWWHAQRGIFAENGTGYDTRLIGNELCDVLPLNRFHPDVPFMKRGDELAPLLVKNGLQQLRLFDLLQSLVLDELMRDRKTVVREYLYDLATLVLREWRTRLTVFSREVALVAPAFAAGLNSTEWFRVADRFPDHVERFKSALAAMFCSELGSDSMALQYLIWKDEVSKVLSTRSTVTIPELWTPDNNAHVQLRAALDEVGPDVSQAINDEERLLTVFRTIDKMISFMMQDEVRQRRMAMMRHTTPINNSGQG